MPDASSEAPGVYRGGIPGSPSSKTHRAPGSLLVHLHSGPKPPFCPMMHQATRANYPPEGPGRVLPEKKFGGVNVGSRNSVLDVAGRVLPLSDFKRRPRASQGASSGFYRDEASSYPGDLELPPAASGASRPDGRTAPARLELTHRPHPSSSQPKATGGVHLSNSVQGKPSTSGPRRPPADGNYIAGRGGLLCAKPQGDSTASPLFIPSTWPEPMGQPRAL